MADPGQFELLKTCDEIDFEDFYQIYADSISERERKPRAWICEMVQRSDYRVFLLKRNSRTAGFSIVFLSALERFALLEYMAVNAEYRNQGLGAEIFQRTAQNTPDPMLLEVDSDREECCDRRLRARRQQFYRRLGCLKLAGLHYLLPLPGGGPPPEMDLMIYSAPRLRSIAKPRLEKWLQTIYKDVYNCSPDDPRIGRMLLRVSDPVALE